jgi:hypothetical protein
MKTIEQGDGRDILHMTVDELIRRCIKDRAVLTTLEIEKKDSEEKVCLVVALGKEAAQALDETVERLDVELGEKLEGERKEDG